MSVYELGSRLRVARTPEQVEQHRAEMRAERKAAAARAQCSKQRAKRLCRTVPWADAEKIEEFYRLAAYLTRKTKVKHEVDHIIPLQGALVSGLHVETNLRVITKAENRRKWNRFEVEVVGDAGIEPATFRV